MQVYYLNLNKIFRNLTVLLLLAATALLFSAIVKQNIPSTASATSNIIYKVQTQQKAVAVTFNVQQGTDIAPVIKSLEEQQRKATFFIAPTWAEENAEAVRHISLKGHEIGILLRNRDIKADLNQNIAKTKELFTHLTGSTPSLVRFDEPELDSTGPETIYSLGFQVIGSSATLDYNNIEHKEWVQPGSILSISLADNANNTPELINNAISTVQENQYNQVTLSELLAYGPGIVK